MMKTLKEENLEFVTKWETERREKFKKYYLYKVKKLGVFIGLLYIVNIIVSIRMGKNNNYILSGIVTLGIILFIPVLSWIVNEIRYKSVNYKKQIKKF